MSDAAYEPPRFDVADVPWRSEHPHPEVSFAMKFRPELTPFAVGDHVPAPARSPIRLLSGRQCAVCPPVQERESVTKVIDVGSDRWSLGRRRSGGDRQLVKRREETGVARSHGIGRHLVQRAIDRARERGCRLLQLTTDRRRPDALAFYESQGFTSSHYGLKLDLFVEDAAGHSQVDGNSAD